MAKIGERQNQQPICPYGPGIQVCFLRLDDNMVWHAVAPQEFGREASVMTPLADDVDRITRKRSHAGRRLCVFDGIPFRIMTLLIPVSDLRADPRRRT